MFKTSSQREEHLQETSLLFFVLETHFIGPVKLITKHSATVCWSHFLVLVVLPAAWTYCALCRSVWFIINRHVLSLYNTRWKVYFFYCKTSSITFKLGKTVSCEQHTTYYSVLCVQHIKCLNAETHPVIQLAVIFSRSNLK